MTGWQPDPTGRHQHRWHDGTRYTSQVSDYGVENDDPGGADPLPIDPGPVHYAGVFDHTAMAIPPVVEAPLVGPPPSLAGSAPLAAPSAHLGPSGHPVGVPAAAYPMAPAGMADGRRSGLPGGVAIAVVISGFYAISALMFGLFVVLVGAATSSAGDEFGSSDFSSAGDQAAGVGVLLTVIGFAMVAGVVLMAMGRNGGRIGTTVWLAIGLGLLLIGAAKNTNSAVGAIVLALPSIVALVGMYVGEAQQVFER